MELDTIVHNGMILTVNGTFDVIADGVVGICDGKIVHVGPKTDDDPLPPAARIIDAENGIVMPGLVNTHTHMPMTLFRGLADDLPLDIWLNQYIFPAEAGHVNPANVRLGTFLACAEMLLAGTTSFCGGYFLEHEVAHTVGTVGIRAILGQGVIDFPAPGVPVPADNIKAAVEYVQKWQGNSSLITPSIFCHSPYTCSSHTLKEAKKAADAHGVLFQVHTAETQNEGALIQEGNSRSPVQYLGDLDVLDGRTLLVHAVWSDDRDIGIIRDSGAAVSHNPESNMKLAAGIAPVPEFLKAGITVGLGTDGCASNNDLDLFQEMDIAAKIHKVNTLDPTVMDAATVLKMATIEGARAIGLEQMTGSIEIGKEADIIVLNTAQPHLVPMYNPVSQIVYAARGSDVRHVLVSGNVLVKNRELQTINIDQVMKEIAFLSRSIKGSRDRGPFFPI